MSDATNKTADTVGGDKPKASRPAVQMRWMRRIKAVLFVLLAVPAAVALWRLYDGQIIDPVEELTHISGEWALRCLMLTMAVTPLRILTNVGALVTLRRMLGLFAFFYALCHLTVYIWLDQYFAWADIVEDVLERRYVFVGMAALLLMIPLAATSFNRAIKWLGAKRWQQLHRLAYISAVAAVLHYLWLVKADQAEPYVYGGLLAAMFAIRIVDWKRKENRRALRKKKA